MSLKKQKRYFRTVFFGGEQDPPGIQRGKRCPAPFSDGSAAVPAPQPFRLGSNPLHKNKRRYFRTVYFGGEQGIRTLEYSLKHYTISNRAPSASSDNSPYLKLFAAESRGFSFANRFYNNIPRYVKSYFAQNSIYYA